MIEMSKNVGPWRERIALAAHNAMKGQPLFPGPTAIFINLVLPRPKSAPKTYTPDATKRPDIDKLARACLDAITGVIIADDAQIIELQATKRLADIGETPGAALEIIALNPTTARSA
jgi:crossover junction endodeoxyribonuclease RusA